MVFDFLKYSFDRFFGDWDHRLTATVGGAATLASLDLVAKLLGIAAVCVAIYCSLARDARERKLAAIARTNAQRAILAELAQK